MSKGPRLLSRFLRTVSLDLRLLRRGPAWSINANAEDWKELTVSREVNIAIYLHIFLLYTFVHFNKKTNVYIILAFLRFPRWIKHISFRLENLLHKIVYAKRNARNISLNWDKYGWFFARVLLWKSSQFEMHSWNYRNICSWIKNISRRRNFIVRTKNLFCISHWIVYVKLRYCSMCYKRYKLTRHCF